MPRLQEVEGNGGKTQGIIKLSWLKFAGERLDCLPFRIEKAICFENFIRFIMAVHGLLGPSSKSINHAISWTRGSIRRTF